jgi:hypothetical protein
MSGQFRTGRQILRGSTRSDRLRSNRGWIALLYVLATVLAQGIHDHGESTDSVVTRHEAGCDDPRLHLSGHPSADLSHGVDECPACQYRAGHHAFEFRPPTHFRPCTALVIEVPAAPVPRATFSLISCRAPPRI